MSKTSPKEQVITFKADESLLEALAGVPNRSAFIRDALLAALDNACPLCRGTGVLTPQQKMHWQQFSEHHAAAECDDCHEIHLICQHEPKKKTSGRKK